MFKSLAAIGLLLAAAQGPIFKTQSELVALSVTVLDDKDRPVDGLSKDAFTVTEDGQQRPIAQFTSESVPLSLVIAVDASESMRGQRFAFAREAVTVFFQAQHAGDELSLIGFNDRSFPLAPWSRSLDAIKLALDLVEPSGTTALYSAVTDSIDLLRMAQHRRQAIVIISDGNDFRMSDINPAASYPPPAYVRSIAAIERIQQSEALVYAIAVDAPPQGGASRDKALDVNALRKLTDPSGGFTLPVRSDRAVPEAARRIADELHHQYVIGFAPTHSSDGRFHSVQVKVAGCRCRVRARAGFVAGRS